MSSAALVRVASPEGWQVSVDPLVSAWRDGETIVRVVWAAIVVSGVGGGDGGVVTLTKLANAEYLLGSVVLGVEEYYVGLGEAPGVWSGAWAAELGLAGMVEADDLRTLLDGVHPGSGVDLVAGLRERKVRAIDVTFSAPKSVSVLWALGSPLVAETVMQAHVEAVSTAMAFLESHASVARRQVDGVRRRVATEGLAVAGFVHRTSREGDPQVHSHCLTVNLTRRVEDGRVVALDAWPLYGWARAAGSVYQAVLQRTLALRLGVEWGPDRNNTREISGFAVAQLRVFSKRAVLIEAELQHLGAAGVQDPGLRARVDDAASLATRRAKDRGLSPHALVGRWETEATGATLVVGDALDRAVCYASPVLAALSFDQLAELLVDAEAGVCARSARFTEADVVEHICGHSAGRLTVEEIQAHTTRFLGSGLVVRLTPEADGHGLAEWSTVAHRALEDRVISQVDDLAAQHRPGLADAELCRGESGSGLDLGTDQRAAVGVLVGSGGGVRCVLAPAGFGKTAMVATAARLAAQAGCPVLGVATTAKAVAELDGAGLRSATIASLRIRLDRDGPLAPGTVVVMDEISQTSTRDAATVLAAVSACRGGRLWVLGDARQGQPVLAGGLADHLVGLVEAGRVPGAALVVNRRQVTPEDRDALHHLRAGRPEVSQTIRTDNGWEHDCGTPTVTREGLVDAAVTDMANHGPDQVAVLCVSHIDAEDLADRIRERLAASGEIRGPVLEGPGWGGRRVFQQGDRVLFHTRHAGKGSGIVNGTTATIHTVDPAGLTVRLDTPGDQVETGRVVDVPAGFVQGARPDGSPNLSHAWARTIDGAQGGTWQTAHLLGTPALDAFRGYVGQSRSRQPTHTWNTTPALVIDHGGTMADRRQPGEHILAALSRTPDTSLAAGSDPHTLDRKLRELIAEHQAVLAGRPPDMAVKIARAHTAYSNAEKAHATAISQLERARDAVERLSPLAALSRNGRLERKTLEGAIGRAEQRADTTTSALTDARGALCLAERGQEKREGFDRREGWRDTDLARLRNELAAHWAEVAVGCVRAGDPLAYGTHVLRASCAHVARQLTVLEQQIPLDRSQLEHQTRSDLRLAIRNRDRARTDLTAARQDLAEATGSRWRTRPAEAAAAQSAVEDALRRLRTAEATERRLRPVLQRLTEYRDARQSVLDATAVERGRLTVERGLLEGGLEETLTARVQALAADPPEHLTRTLGSVPENQTGRAVWCHYATRHEHALDTGTCHPGVQPDHAARQHITIAASRTDLALAVDTPDGPETWATTAREIDHRSPTSPTRGHQPGIEPDQGIELGW